MGFTLRFIKDLTSELNAELEKIEVNSTQGRLDDIFVNCDGVIAKMTSRISQLRSTSAM